MADEKINIGKAAPSFVHAPRCERLYNGPADPVALWAEARVTVGIAEGQSDGSKRPRVQEVYEKLCAGRAEVNVLATTVQGGSNELHQVIKHSSAEVVLGGLGKSVLGGDTSVATTGEVA